MGRRNHRERGFSLLEVIVAFLVFALTASIVLTIASRALGGAELAARYQHALMLAESLLDRAAVEQPPPGSRFEGIAPGNLHWTVSIEAEPGFDGPRIRLLRARADVDLDAGRRVTLQTLIAAQP